MALNERGSNREVMPTPEDREVLRLMNLTPEQLTDYRRTTQQLGPLTYFVLEARRALMMRSTDDPADTRLANTKKYDSIVDPVLRYLSVDKDEITVLDEVEKKRVATIEEWFNFYFEEKVDPNLSAPELIKEKLRVEDLKKAEQDMEHDKVRKIMAEITQDKFIRFYKMEPEKRREILRILETLSSLFLIKTETKDPAKELSQQTYQRLNLDSGKLGKYLTAMAEHGYALKYLVDLFLLSETQNIVPGILDAISKKTKTEGLTLNLIRDCSDVVSQIKKNLELLKERIGNKAGESLEDARDKIMGSFSTNPSEMADLLKDINFLESLI